MEISRSFYRGARWIFQFSKLNICFLVGGPDAEEEENQTQLEPPPGSPHRLGDGLARAPAPLCLHQVPLLAVGVV